MTQLSLLGEEWTVTEMEKREHESKKADEAYNEFTEKFKPKKTTDDCYTPSEVYEVVKEYALNMFPEWREREIVRPFYPGGDFVNYPYPENCVVIDNPPFSILAKILRYYRERGIQFFLFAPALTLLSSANKDFTYIIPNANITYENGASVRTAFVTNGQSDIQLMTAPELMQAISEAQKKVKKEAKPKVAVTFDFHITSAALVQKLCVPGLVFEVKKSECMMCKKTGEHNYQIFGGGILMSTKAAERYVEALKQAEALKPKITVPLSLAEKWIAEQLDEKCHDE